MADVPWNWCPTCSQHVDVDDCHDGSGVTCVGCRTVYVAVSYEDGKWSLEPEGDSNEEEDDDG